MSKRRLWPTITYLVICALIWAARIWPESHSESHAWVSGILLTVTSLPSIIAVEMLGSELYTAHILGQLTWIPAFGEIFPFLISQVINVCFIFFATSARQRTVIDIGGYENP
jgi:hypothetical protein